MKLRHKLGLGLILSATLPALLVAWLHSASYLKSAETAHDASTSALIQSTTKSLDDLMQNAARDIRGIAIGLKQTGTAEAISQQLAVYTYAYPYFDEIMWVSPQGKVLASSDPAHRGQALQAIYVELTDDLPEVMRKPAGELYISDFDDVGPEQRAAIAAGRAHQEVLTLQFLLRMDDGNGKASGVLVAVMNNPAIVGQLQNLQHNMQDGGPVLLLNRRGEILLSSDPRAAPLARHPLAGRIEQESDLLTGRPLKFNGELDGKELDFIMTGTSGIGLAHTTAWRLLLTSHSDEAILATAWHTLYQTVILLAAIIGIGGLFSLWLARSIVRPIEALSVTASRIGGGDLAARAPSASNDEIGNMARAFNTMAGIIERERNELEQKIIARTAALEQAKLEVEQASRGKDEFLAAISHELKTPLNHILGFADLLKEGLAGELNAEQQGMAQDIFDAGSKQLAIVNSLIELARLQAGKVALQAEREDPAKMLSEIAARHAAKAEAAGLAFSVEVAEGLGEMPLDREVVTHLLDQLLANAFKFTPSGGKVSLAARRVPRTDVAAPVQSEAGEYLELAVADNGPGIAPEILPRLFQSFVQGDGRLTRSHAGTGVGLVLIKLLAELHGGGSGVQSEPGAGAKFLVWLPCGAAETGG